jgi:hypothetical protein
MQYKIIPFEGNEKLEDLSIEELTEFIADAEILITDLYAYSKDSIKEVAMTLRGAGLYFNDGTMTCGYYIESKLVKFE